MFDENEHIHPQNNDEGPRHIHRGIKRSCLPDGPKVGSVTLSPRGDWRMPSDAAAALWLAELEQIPLKG